MDPIMLVTGGAAALAIGVLLYLLFRRRIKQRKKLQEAPPRAGMGSGTDAVRSVPMPAPPLAAPTPAPSAPVAIPQPIITRKSHDEMIAEVLTHVAFTRQRVQVGWRDVGERVIGEVVEERPFPVDEIEIRPIRSMAELPRLIASERTADSMLRLIRAVSGQALVEEYRERVSVMEPIREPVYEDVKKILYLLLDCSLSMFDRTWSVPVWKGIALALLRRARKEGAVFHGRPFGSAPGPLQTANSPETETAVVQFIQGAPKIGGTDIGAALHAAMADFAKPEFACDMADIVMVTDGEDGGGMDPHQMRAQLTQSRIRLHAVLFGAQNAALRNCADVYQEIPERGIIRPPIRRAS